MRSIWWALAVLILVGCAGTSREEKEGSGMAKPLSGGPPANGPVGAFSYPLTGSIQGSVSVDPSGTNLDIEATSSKNEWDQNYRVLGTLDSASRPPVLHCRVYPGEKFGPEIQITIGGAAPAAAGQIALSDGAGAAWGLVAYDRDTIRVIDPDGRTRVEIVRVQPDDPPVRDGFTLPATGPALFHLRVVDANGTPVKRDVGYQP